MKKNDKKKNNPEHAGSVGTKHNNKKKFSPDIFFNPGNFEWPEFKYEDKHGV